MTDATDNFNRASLGTNWTQSTSFTNLTITGSTAVTGAGGNNTDNVAWWNANSFGSNHYSETVIGTDGTTGTGGGPCVRHQSAASTMYLFFTDDGTFASIYEVTAGSFATLGAPYTATHVAGTTHRLDATGSTLTPSINGSAQATRSDSTITGGAPAIHVFNATGTNRSYTSWLGGPILSSFTYFGLVQPDTPPAFRVVRMQGY